MFRTAALRGVAAGMAGVAVMTVAEKVEQRLTRRPNSYVPGRTLLALVAERPPEWAQPTVWEPRHALGHWGTGALLGGLRGIWAATGLRGPRANLVHTVVRLATDQTFENAVGVGAPPWTWPRQEQMIDVAHKAIYSFVSRLDRRSRHHLHPVLYSRNSQSLILGRAR
ncbi:MAG TPA: hypothetical protein VNA67_06695 [Pseudonocardiaceae bacterium]|nr:hypothetical protein [Pseudonocardiaceae bacterium]